MSETTDKADRRAQENAELAADWIMVERLLSEKKWERVAAKHDLAKYESEFRRARIERMVGEKKQRRERATG